MELIFAEMSHANFYPEDRDDDLIEITCVAPKDTEVYAGEVVIMDRQQYEELKMVMRDRFEKLIVIGFDKNGEADFRIRGDVAELSGERMNQLRQMIPVAIGSAEEMFRDSTQRKNAGFQAQAEPPTV